MPIVRPHALFSLINFDRKPGWLARHGRESVFCRLFRGRLWQASSGTLPEIVGPIAQLVRARA